MDDADHPIQGTRSRGAMVTAWLTAATEETTDEFVGRLLGGEGVKGVGGFSLLCGKLRRRKDAENELEPLAIISNRSEDSNDVPRIAEKRGEVYGLSNTSYSDPEIWPKVKMGKEKVLQVVEEVVAGKLGEEELVEKFWGVLDTDTLPIREGIDFEAYIEELRKSIFIRSINDTVAANGVPKADEIASANPEAVNGDRNGHNNTQVNGTSKADQHASVEPKITNGHCTIHNITNTVAETSLTEGERSDPSTPSFDGMSGPYGTQRQTIILVDWEGNVKFIERSLYDSQGKPITRGKGDMSFNFKIEGWNEESTKVSAKTN